MAEENRPDFSKLVAELQKQNDIANAAKDETENISKLSMAMDNSALNLESEQIKLIEELIEQLTNPNLGDLEERKENNKRAKETLDLLGIIADNTEKENEVIKFDGIGQAGLGFVAALGAALAGLVTGIIAGLVGNIKIIGRLFKIGFTKLFGGLFKRLSAPFRSVNKQAKGFLKPATDFFKNIGRAFKAGFGGLKTFRATTGRFAKLGFLVL